MVMETSCISAMNDDDRGIAMDKFFLPFFVLDGGSGVSAVRTCDFFLTRRFAMSDDCRSLCWMSSNLTFGISVSLEEPPPIEKGYIGFR